MKYIALALLLCSCGVAAASQPAAPAAGPAHAADNAPKDLAEYGRRAHAVKKASRLERMSLYRSYKAARKQRHAAELKAMNAANVKAIEAAEAKAEGK